MRKASYILFSLAALLLLLAQRVLILVNKTVFYYDTNLEKLIDVGIKLMRFGIICLIAYFCWLLIFKYKIHKKSEICLAVLVILMALIFWFSNNYKDTECPTAYIYGPIIIEKNIEESYVQVSSNNGKYTIYCTDGEVSLMQLNQEYNYLAYRYAPENIAQGYLVYIE